MLKRRQSSLRLRPAIAMALAMGVVSAEDALAGTFGVSKTLDSTIDTAAWNAANGSTYGRAINGNSFETSTITTFNGYQYTAYWQNVSNQGRVAVARRPVGSTASWQVMTLASAFVNGANDAHNVVSLGIDHNDGTMHLAFDMHGHTLRYRVSQPGIATNPGTVTWTTANAGAIFNVERNYLTGTSAINGVTYPIFINTPSGDMQLAFRIGSSGSGSWSIYDYNGTSHSWTGSRQIDNGLVDTYTGTVTASSNTRNNYNNGFTYDANGRLHMTFTWRESATGAANHDILYAYSDDGGNTWKNSAGTTVTTPGGEIMHLNSPGLVVRPLSESMSLMNQNGQAVDHANRIHSATWHVNPAKRTSNTSAWKPNESSYFQTWRDSLGNWHENKLPGNVGARPKIFFDANDNAYMIYQGVAGGGSLTAGSGSNLYFTNGDLVIQAASKASNWTDWRIVKVETGNFVSEAQFDLERWLSSGVLTVEMQNSPTQTGNQGTALRAMDYSLTFTAATNRTFTTASGDWDTAGNWSAAAVPGLNSFVTINSGRTARVDQNVAARDNMVAVGSGGTTGTLNVIAGGTLTLTGTGSYTSTFGGSIIVGKDSGSTGIYTQSGGNVSAWRFAVGDFTSETSGGGASTATLSGGLLTTYELDVGFSANGSSNGSHFINSGGTLNVNGDFIIGEFGSTASATLSGGLTTVLGDVREGFNKTNNSRLTFAGGTLDMTGKTITIDTINYGSGQLQNVSQINAGGAIAKNAAGIMTFAGSNGFTGQVQITAGSLRVASATALGTTAGNTIIDGGTTTGQLELVNNITLAEPLTLAGRQLGSANLPHIVNISGANAISSNLTAAIGGDRFNLQSDAGTLTIAGSVLFNATAGARYLQLQGAGTGVVSTPLVNGAAVLNIIKTGAGQWTLAGSNTVSGDVTVSAGVLRFTGALNPTTPAQLIVADGGVATIDGTTVNVRRATGTNVTVQNGGLLKVASNGTSAAVGTITGSLTLTGTSKFDLTNNALILTSTAKLNGSAITVDSLRALLISGRGGTGTANVTWNGAGIMTSSFQDVAIDSIGYVWNADPQLLFAAVPEAQGISAAPTDFIVKYTRAGDADLSGLVDDVDVAVIGLNYDSGATTGRHWYEGDFNYDGRINDDDVAILGLTYDPGASALSPQFYAALSSDYGAQFAYAFKNATSIVPEPTSLGLLSLGAITLVRRRRKK